MAYPRKVTTEMLDRMEQVVLQRLAVPSDKEIAHELNCHIKLVQRWMTRIRTGMFHEKWRLGQK